MMRRLAGRLLVALGLVAFAAGASAADIVIPKLTGRVVDQANILNQSDEARLTAKAKDLESKTSIQLVIVTLSSLGGDTIEDWGLALGRGWGIGQKGKDNGVLLIVAPSDREVRIEVGYGLEGSLTDARSSAIIRNVIIPRFRAGNMAGGISDGADAVVSVLTGTGEEFTPTLMETAASVWEHWAPFIIVVAAILFIVISRILHGRDGPGRGRYYRRRNGAWYYYDNDRSSSGWSSGGGGGFSGGGGGFGGGGASGRW
jgi:uncharacterized protein